MRYLFIILLFLGFQSIAQNTNSTNANNKVRTNSSSPSLSYNALNVLNYSKGEKNFKITKYTNTSHTLSAADTVGSQMIYMKSPTLVDFVIPTHATLPVKAGFTITVVQDTIGPIKATPVSGTVKFKPANASGLLTTQYKAQPIVFQNENGTDTWVVFIADTTSVFGGGSGTPGTDRYNWTIKSANFGPIVADTLTNVAYRVKSASDITVTVPNYSTQAFKPGESFLFEQDSTGHIIFTAAAGVRLVKDGSLSETMLPKQYAVLTNMGLPNYWNLSVRDTTSSSGGSAGVTSFEARTGVVTSSNGDYTATEITNTPAGNIAATNAQTALNELDTEKQSVLTNSAGLRGALSDEVGTGAAYFVGGALGTPASATLTNATGLPNAGLVNSSITFSAGTSGTAPNWTTSPVSLGGTATINSPLMAATLVTQGDLSNTTQTIPGAKTFTDNVTATPTVSGQGEFLVQNLSSNTAAYSEFRALDNGGTINLQMGVFSTAYSHASHTAYGPGDSFIQSQSPKHHTVLQRTAGEFDWIVGGNETAANTFMRLYIPSSGVKGLSIAGAGTAPVPTSTLTVVGSFGAGFTQKTGAYTLTDADNTVEVTSGTHTQTLPTAVGITGREYWITNTGSGTVTVGTTSSQTFVNVSGTPTTQTLAQFATGHYKSNGANWLELDSQPTYAGSFSGVGTATTAFTVTIGTTQANNTYKTVVTPTAALSAALFYISAKTTTTFTVTYLAGLTGTVTFDWVLVP